MLYTPTALDLASATFALKISTVFSNAFLLFTKVTVPKESVQLAELKKLHLKHKKELTEIHRPVPAHQSDLSSL